MTHNIFLIFLFCLSFITTYAESVPKEGLPLYYWRQDAFTNFGDYLSLKIVERIVQQPVVPYRRRPTNNDKKLLALGSLLSFAEDDDVIWGTGVNGKLPNKDSYKFTRLDIRAVRGPITRTFLKDHFGIVCPEIYGDPALLMPYLFPEYQRKKNPKYPYIIIPHYSEKYLFPKSQYPNVVYPTDPWEEVLGAILNSRFVIASSMHGIVVAEAYGIPARMLRVTENEPLLKYCDYFYGTNRFDFTYATSVEEALQMGGERPIQCDLKKLFEAFPFEFWPNARFYEPDFNEANNGVE